jgi:hypothetical protein
MGGHNIVRPTPTTLQYNDIWDLNVPGLPDKVVNNFLGKKFLSTGTHDIGDFKQALLKGVDNHSYFSKYKTDEIKNFINTNFRLGGIIPGSTGFTYARTGSTPSNGKYAKKTLPSAQNGQEMSFYQNGLDFTPKMISENGSIVKDDNGYWNPDNWGKPVEINSNNITMHGVHQPLIGVSDVGDTKLMMPGENHKFKGKKVTEFPIAQKGKELIKLDQLTNFTNYNTPQPGGWLDKYSK